MLVMPNTEKSVIKSSTCSYSAQMDTAMMLHFNVLTPHHDGPAGGGGNSAQGLPPRPAKRGSPTPSNGPAGSVDWYVSGLFVS